jgi:hypothetical protein
VRRGGSFMPGATPARTTATRRWPGARTPT